MHTYMPPTPQTENTLQFLPRWAATIWAHFDPFFHQNAQENLGVLKREWPKGKKGEKKIRSQTHQSCKKIAQEQQLSKGRRGGRYVMLNQMVRREEHPSRHSSQSLQEPRE